MNEAYENRNPEGEKESFPAPPERTPIRFPAFTPCGETLILTETGHPCGPGGGPDARAGKQVSLAELASPSDSGNANSIPADGADSGNASSLSDSDIIGTGTPTTGPETRAGKQVSLVEMISPSDSGNAGGEAPADGASGEAPAAMQTSLAEAVSLSNSGNIGTGTPTTAFIEETTQPTPISPQEGNPEPNPEPSQEQNPNAEANGTLSQKLNQGAETPCMAAAPSPPQEQSPNAVLNTLRPLLEALCQGLANAAATPPQSLNQGAPAHDPFLSLNQGAQPHSTPQACKHAVSPPPPPQETPAELAARVLSSPEALKAFEEMRMRQAEAVRRSLPILTPSRGQSTSPALAPDLPATMEEAAERARKIFGL